MFQTPCAKKYIFSIGILSKLVVIYCAKQYPIPHTLASSLATWSAFHQPSENIGKNELKVNRQAAGGDSEFCLLAVMLPNWPTPGIRPKVEDPHPHARPPPVAGVRHILRIKEVTSKQAKTMLFG